MNVEQLVAAWTTVNGNQVLLAKKIERELHAALAEACEAEGVCIRKGMVLPRRGDGPTPEHPRTAGLVALARSMQFFHLLHEVGYSDVLVRLADLYSGDRFKTPGVDCAFTKYCLLSQDLDDYDCYAVQDGVTDIWKFSYTLEVIRV